MLIKTKSKTNQNWGSRKDYLHKKRLEIAQRIKEGLFTHDEMMQRDCKSSQEEQMRVHKYCQWKTKRERDMEAWHKINREFKEHGEEGKLQTMDELRKSVQTGKNEKYE